MPQTQELKDLPQETELCVREGLSALRNKAIRQIIRRSHNINTVGRELQVWVLVLSANGSECSKPSLLYQQDGVCISLEL